jgi:hypothetical protein
MVACCSKPHSQRGRQAGAASHPRGQRAAGRVQCACGDQGRRQQAVATACVSDGKPPMPLLARSPPGVACLSHTHHSNALGTFKCASKANRTGEVPVRGRVGTNAPWAGPQGRMSPMGCALGRRGGGGGGGWQWVAWSVKRRGARAPCVQHGVGVWRTCVQAGGAPVGCPAHSCKGTAVNAGTRLETARPATEHTGAGVPPARHVCVCAWALSLAKRQPAPLECCMSAQPGAMDAACPLHAARQAAPPTAAARRSRFGAAVGCSQRVCPVQPLLQRC